LEGSWRFSIARQGLCRCAAVKPGRETGLGELRIIWQALLLVARLSKYNPRTRVVLAGLPVFA